jgi:hypothetical protein
VFVELKQRTRRWLLFGGIAVCLLLLLILSAFEFSPRGRFARFVHAPIASSVSDVEAEGHDWFGLLPEPVVRLRFSAAPKDLLRVLSDRRATPLKGDAIGAAATGQAWWPTQGELARMQGYALKGKYPEFLWIDATGTNAYYLLFGI